MRLGVEAFRKLKREGQKPVVLTAYDAPSAELAVEAGIDFIFVGDSVATVVLGLKTTAELRFEQIRHHAQAVLRGAGGRYVLVDLPHCVCGNPEDAVCAAQQLKDDGVSGVKLEGFKPEIFSAVTGLDMDIWGHLGYLPQTMGPPRQIAKGVEEGQQLLDAAIAMEQSGAVAVVLELIPPALGQRVTNALTIPTIGIGAGWGTSGQVQVWHDVLGLSPVVFRHAIREFDGRTQFLKALERFRNKVRDRDANPGETAVF